MSIDNGVVVLQEGKAATMKFSSMKITQAQRKDPETGHFSTVNRLSCQVIELNGKPELTVFDTLSEKLTAQLLPYANDSNLPNKVFQIIKTGRGYATEYSVMVS